MDPAEIKSELASLNAALGALERTLTGNQIPLDVVSDFKSSVDDLRLRLWGVLTARNAGDQIAFQRRFRLRRTRELCLQIGSELRVGDLTADQEEIHKLLVAARGLVAAANAALGMPETP